MATVYVVRKLMDEGCDGIVSIHLTEEGAEKATETREDERFMYYVQEWEVEE
jgi:hypothetical protein